MSVAQQKQLHAAIRSALEEHGSGIPVAEVYGVLEVAKLNIHENLVRSQPTIVTPEDNGGG